HRRRATAPELRPQPAGNRRVHGWQHLPMRHVYSDHRRDPSGRAGGEGGQPMSEHLDAITGPPDGLAAGCEVEFERYELREGPAYRFELDRRDFLKALGGGLLVLCLLDRDAPEVEAQQPGGRRGGFGGGSVPQDIGAWLHIGEDGRVTVYTG